MKEIKTVPNQRVLTIDKQPTDKQHFYTANNLKALDQAAGRLQSKGGFKLYMYLAKNQDKYHFALFSSDFCAWSGLGIKAYNSAFDELVTEGYLIEKGKNNYIFHDLSQKEEENEFVNIEIPKEKVEEAAAAKKDLSFFF